MDEKDLARTLGFLRALLGVTAFVAPKKFARLWTGESPEMAVSHMAIRGLGVRDVGVGMGLLLALENDGHVRRWLEIGAMADAGDAVSTMLSFKKFRSWRRYPILASEIGSALLGMQLAEALDD